MANAIFSRKETVLDDINKTIAERNDKRNYVIEKNVKLSTSDFQKFSQNLLDDYDFISENTDLMYVDNDNVWHCILVSQEDSRTGILVQSEGYNYARYTSYFEEEDYLTDKILEQILIIRSEGKYNMLDTICVQSEANKKGFYELVIFIEEYKMKYVEFIMTGQR